MVTGHGSVRNIRARADVASRARPLASGAPIAAATPRLVVPTAWKPAWANSIADA